MKLEFSIKDICTITDAVFIEDNQTSEIYQIRNIIIDSRSPSISLETLFVTLKGRNHTGKSFVSDFISKGGGFVLCDSQLDLKGIHQFIVKDPLLALQKLAKTHRLKFNIPVVGITGSNGKTIVKEWLYHVLKNDFSIVRSPKSYNSQIGVALSLLEIEKENDIAIIEAGISQPSEMDVLADMIQPSLGVFVGIGDAHAINFESKEKKKEEKFKLFKHVETLIENDDSEFNLAIPFKDKASQMNAKLIVKTAEYFGLSKDKIERKMKDLPSISMRMEQIEGKNNNLIINDAYSSDLLSLDLALSHINGIAKGRKKVLILSALEGISKEKAKTEILKLLDPKNVDEIIFIGEDSYLDEHVECNHFQDVNSLLIELPEFENSIILIKGARSVGLEKIVQAYSAKKHITQLKVNLSAIRNNLDYFRSKINQDCKVLAMVKAQSYGTGLKEMAQFLQNQNVDYFGVAYADEGVLLRKSGIKQGILVMNPEESAFDDILKYDLEPSLYSSQLLNSFIHHLILSQKSKFPIHIKIDTGMNRLGFRENEIDDLINTLKTQPEIILKSVFSHLSVADDAHEHEFTYGQIRKFEMMTGKFMDKMDYKFFRHLANSAGVLNYSSSHFDMVRLGIGLFGLLDVENEEMENVLTMTSRISQIKWIEEGDSVGYGRSFIASKKMRIGIVPVGYADGLRRGLGQGNWSVIINGEEIPLIGKICMDMCIVDLSDSMAKTSDLVEVFGKRNSIFDMAQILKTIPYEVISGISTRVHRVYLED